MLCDTFPENDTRHKFVFAERHIGGRPSLEESLLANPAFTTHIYIIDLALGKRHKQTTLEVHERRCQWQ